MIILFGGNGFIGRHIAAAAEGRTPVTVVSSDRDHDFFDSHAPCATFMPVEDFVSDAGASLIKSARAFVHLANSAHPGSNVESPWDEITENVTPNFRCFVRAAELNPGLRIVYASSGGTVYGEGHWTPIPESARVAPVSAYGLAKVLSEEVLAYVSRLTGIEYAVLRIANPVGRRHKNREQGLIEVAVKRAMAGEPLSLFGDGSHVRDYFDVDDLAEAFLSVVSSEKLVRGIWNIGSGRGRSILEVIDLVKTRVRRDIGLTFLPSRPWDVAYSVLDASAALNDFGWSTHTPLERSIDKIAGNLL